MNILIVIIAAFCINLPVGYVRHRFRKLSIRWWLWIHSSIPIIVALRILLDTPKVWIPLFIAVAIGGQFVGNKIYKLRVKNWLRGRGKSEE